MSIKVSNHIIISYIDNINDNICIDNLDFLYENILNIDKSIILYYIGNENIENLKEELKQEYNNFKEKVSLYLKEKNINFNDFYFYRYEDQKRLLKNFKYEYLNKKFYFIFFNEINLHFQKYNKIMYFLDNIRICSKYDITDCYYINKINKNKIICDKDFYENNQESFFALNYEFNIYSSNYKYLKIEFK